MIRMILRNIVYYCTMVVLLVIMILVMVFAKDRTWDSAVAKEKEEEMRDI